MKSLKNTMPDNNTSDMKKKKQKDEVRQLIRFLGLFKMDFLILIEIIIASTTLVHILDPSKTYHKIKGQNAIKLYALFGFLEMADKMLSTMGQDLLLAMYKKTTSLGLLSGSGGNSTNGSNNSSENGTTTANASATNIIPSNGNLNKNILQNCPPPSSIKLFILLFIIRCVYLIIHATVLSFQTVALNVAVNSYSNSLGTLLLSMQFSEIKSSVFKKFDKEGLFQLSMADIVERFQLITMLSIITIRNLTTTTVPFGSAPLPQSWILKFFPFNIKNSGGFIIGALCGPMIKVIGSEFIVDWVKHSYIGRFNKFRPSLYDKVFTKILVQDYLDHTNFKLQIRLGVPIQAQVISFLVLLLPKLKQLLENVPFYIRASWILSIWVLVLILKFFLQWGLDKIGKSIINGSNNVSKRSTLISDHSGHTGTMTNGTKNKNKNKNNNTAGKSNNSTINSTSLYYVPGELSGGQGIVDDNMRQVLYGDNVIPPSVSELRIRKDRKDSKSLEKVERYKMSSKRIW
ncbi:uncharacterized protein SCODWIG_03568 [Saccharomycodes ludwigii]|uniref:DUF747-domain-containing protein n=2 Tax=Saccharomycodes ludwigii TaxID=36035 RepID=A0A376BAZ9_9ASCO|nr:uncharacterized protein SCODWIG_03568 [Saccharomycodes ludwigii]